MDNSTREQGMGLRFYGYGLWEAPYWFIGPEQGKGRKEAADNTQRVNAWFRLGATSLCDNHDFHCLIGEKDWHKEKPNLQPTWRPLMLLLKTFLNEPSDNDSLRAYQRDLWGRVNGGTACLIELSGLAVRSSRERMDRGQFRPERIKIIHERMLRHKPEFVVMYGANDKVYWEEIAGCALVCDDVVKVGTTMIAFAPHPNTRGRKNTDWVELGKKLRRCS